MNLQLSLKQKWFEMTASGEKPEDYREITPYWCARLLRLNGEHKKQSFWEEYLRKLLLSERGEIIRYWETFPLKYWNITYKQFKTNTMILGYPKATDTNKILKYKHAGIEIRTGNPEWGAEKDKLYFVIKHGKRL